MLPEWQVFPKLIQNAFFPFSFICHHVPLFVFEPNETVPFRPRDVRLTVVDAALAIVAFAGTIPHSMANTGKVTGHINEFITASGVTDKAVASTADFYIDGNYVSAVGSQADGITGFKNYISELYNATTGKLISYEVRETQSVAGVSVTFNTLWYDLYDISGITSIKYDVDGKKFYVNGSAKAWEVKKVGGFSLKNQSRRFDIEFRTQYFYTADGEEVVVKVPMLFVQEEQYDDLVKDVKSENGIDISVNVSTTNRNKQKSDYDTLVDAFINNKTDITVDYIIEYIGDPVEFN